ncbi:putative pre-rrna-processing protein ipi1 [Phaeomoniella chlamydospora]|uniref:Pre-rRNA-processing protein n=1 Tax=Phaeomoniella chlamydospora TaxID=158046 RepID=A0A0G2DVG8_PHACM|nr:putative pre-rrna-processing protein ipi1 [Phaeomoniella chlamydospora]
MGSSAKKKREKKKDFTKTKLKVGKTKPKASSHTDTSFRAKAIVLNQQSLSTSAPTSSAQFSHHTSLLGSKSDAQRRDSLAFLTTFVASRPVDSPLPQPISFLLPKLCPLILDASPSVRTQLLKLFKALPEEELRDHASEILPYLRAGMTHLAADIRLSANDTLSWLLDVAGEEIVSCPGGFIKTMNCFMSMLNWHSSKAGMGQTKFGKPGTEGKSMSKILQCLGEFLKISVGTDDTIQMDKFDEARTLMWPYWHLNHHMISTRSNAYGYLNLFGPSRDDDSQMLEDRDDRIAYFNKQYRGIVEAGVEQAKREGGEIGRNVAGLTRALKSAKTESGD